jgi:hypothetical protein
VAEVARLEVILLHVIKSAILPFDVVERREGKEIAIGVANGAVALNDFVAFVRQWWRVSS